MKLIEKWMLHIADSDWTWTGFNWMRPAKQQRIGLGWILFSSLLLSLPGIAVATGLIYWKLEKLEFKIWLGVFVFAMVISLSFHMLFARFWNRRATGLPGRKTHG